MKHRHQFLIAVALLLALTACVTGPSASHAKAPVVLTIIETRTRTAPIFPYDFKTDKPKATNLAQAVTLIRAERAKPGAEVILLDGGDNLQGQPIIYYYNFVEDAKLSVFSKMMNVIGYDAVGVGNHDVETGHAVYDKVNRELIGGFVTANLVDEKTKEPYFKPYTVVTRGGIKIAILGLTTPGFRKNFPVVLYKGIEIQDMVETAKKWVPIIQAKEKPDLLIGLFHSGVDYTYAKGEGFDTPLNENAAQVVIQKVPGFDAIFAGHDHQGWEGPGYDPATKTRVDIKDPTGKVVPIYGALDDCRKIIIATVTMQYDPEAKVWNKSFSGQARAHGRRGPRPGLPGRVRHRVQGRQDLGVPPHRQGGRRDEGPRLDLRRLRLRGHGPHAPARPDEGPGQRPEARADLLLRPARHRRRGALERRRHGLRARHVQPVPVRELDVHDGSHR